MSEEIKDIKEDIDVSQYVEEKEFAPLRIYQSVWFFGWEIVFAIIMAILGLAMLIGGIVLYINFKNFALLLVGACLLVASIFWICFSFFRVLSKTVVADSTSVSKISSGPFHKKNSIDYTLVNSVEIKQYSTFSKLADYADLIFNKSNGDKLIIHAVKRPYFVKDYFFSIFKQRDIKEAVKKAILKERESASH